jgi:hypothetical protein
VACLSKALGKRLISEQPNHGTSEFVRIRRVNQQAGDGGEDPPSSAVPPSLMRSGTEVLIFLARLLRGCESCCEFF